jgi:hypothetical protein
MGTLMNTGCPSTRTWSSRRPFCSSNAQSPPAVGNRRFMHLLRHALARHRRCIGPSPQARLSAPRCSQARLQLDRARDDPCSRRDARGDRIVGVDRADPHARPELARVVASVAVSGDAHSTPEAYQAAIVRMDRDEVVSATNSMRWARDIARLAPILFACPTTNFAINSIGSRRRRYKIRIRGTPRPPAARRAPKTCGGQK